MGCMNNLSSRKYQRKKLGGGLRSGDREGHRPYPTIQSPENSRSIIVVVIKVCGNSPIQFAITIFSKISVVIGPVFLQCYGAFYLSKLFNTGHAACYKHFLCHEILLPAGEFFVLFSTLPEYALLNAS
jgi:hypothetical protein